VLKESPTKSPSLQSKELPVCSLKVDNASKSKVPAFKVTFVSDQVTVAGAVKVEVPSLVKEQPVIAKLLEELKEPPAAMLTSPPVVQET